MTAGPATAVGLWSIPSGSGDMTVALFPMRIPAGIALGSNQGDRAAEIEAGFGFLCTLAVDGRVLRSPVIETAPVDCPPGSALFLNAVAEIQLDPAALPPGDLLRRLQDFETERGRPRDHAHHAARPLDLDILYYGVRAVQTPELTIPHPRLTERRFVLEPLAHLRPDLVLPGQTRSVSELLAAGAPADSGVGFGMDSHQQLQKIERLAYKLWEKEGCPPGRALVNWLIAEKQLSDKAFLEQEILTEESEGGVVLPKP
jgi:2-amino-4-hydroxy-6-hydroxymethyldihydropteridine diphosphokinase